MPAAYAQKNVTKMDQGLSIAFGEARVELAVANTDALRLSVAYGKLPVPSASSFLKDTNAAEVSWRFVRQHGLVGIKSKAGSLLINPQSGEWTLLDIHGGTLIPLHSLGESNWQAVPANQSVNLLLGWKKGTPIAVYGCGNGTSALQQSDVSAGTANGRAMLPYYWSKTGYAVLAVSGDDNHPARWKKAADGGSVTWTFPGRQADLYLMPASSLESAVGAYAHLTGSAPVPPRWAFGYLQSRWGWTNRADFEGTLKHFQELKLPLDALIFDFEWYATKPDYSLSDQGEGDFKDFGWNTNLFDEPDQQIAAYKAQDVRTVMIRKPRLGNAELLKMVHAKHWDLKSHVDGRVPVRDIDFSNPDLRDWYVGQSAGLFQSGIAGWWNDEGENSFTTYFYWNLAETAALAKYRPGERLWTLNRSFSPGTQRFGAGAWTGDIVSNWKTLAETPVSLLNWGLAGMPYGACDIGGFFENPSPELLTRWMEAGVFFPIMRSHSEVHFQPRFPWLYGPEALSAIRQTLELRYRLIPYYYSLAHETFASGMPLMRALVLEFPDDPKVAGMADEWLVGRGLLVAPLLQSGGKRSVYLPAGDWYVFESNRVRKGNATMEVQEGLSEIPMYVRSGTILTLGPVIQHTSETPGGPLELQIYPGKDATFTLVEDDGVTTDYLKGKVRRTIFKWDDSKKSLSWKRDGSYSGRDVFQQIYVTVFDPRGTVEARSALDGAGLIKHLQPAR